MFIILIELASSILTPEADECGKMMLNDEWQQKKMHALDVKFKTCVCARKRFCSVRLSLHTPISRKIHSVSW